MESIATQNGPGRRENIGREREGGEKKTGQGEKEEKERQYVLSSTTKKLCRPLSTGTHRGTIAIMRKLRSRRVSFFLSFSRLCNSHRLAPRFSFRPSYLRPASRPHGIAGLPFVFLAYRSHPRRDWPTVFRLLYPKIEGKRWKTKTCPIGHDSD